MSRNMCKLRLKLREVNFYPLEVQNSKLNISKIYSSLTWNARLIPKVTFERYWGEESRIFLIRGLTSHNIAYSKLVPCILKKIYWQTLCHGKMNLDILTLHNSPLGITDRGKTTYLKLFIENTPPPQIYCFIYTP